MWFAIPSSYGTFTLNTLPVYPGAPLERRCHRKAQRTPASRDLRPRSSPTILSTSRQSCRISCPSFTESYGGRPVISRILFRFLASSSTRLNQLRSGEVHVVDNVPLDKLKEVESLPGVRLTRTMANSYLNAALNAKTVPPFGDVRVRQAVAHAIDREAIVRDVMEGVVTRVDTVIQPVSWAFNPNVKFYPYDPARARALLREAGFEDVDGSGVVERDGKPLAFEGTTRAGHAEWEKVLQVVQSQLRAVGIQLNVRNYEPTLLGELWFGGKLDFFLSAWTLPADPEITLFFASDPR